MRLLLPFAIVCAAGLLSPCAAQLAAKSESLQKELALLEPERPENRKGIANALLTFYQRNISALISADCLYTLSCSRFSRKAIMNHGLVPGVLMTADRLCRCAAFCGRDIPDYRKNEDGLAADNP